MSTESFRHLPTPLARWGEANRLAGCRWVEVAGDQITQITPERAVDVGGVEMISRAVTDRTNTYFVSRPLRDAPRNPEAPAVIVDIAVIYWLSVPTAYLGRAVI